MTAPRGDSCVLVVFGAAGDMMRRLLMPSLYNLACDGLLPQRFAIIGVAREEQTDEQFRVHMSSEVQRFSTRKDFDAATWDRLRDRLHYTHGRFEDDATYRRIAELLEKLGAQHQTG